MGFRSCFLVTIRLLQATCALAVIAFGAWIIHMIDSVRDKVDELIQLVLSNHPNLEQHVQSFFDDLLQTPKRIYFSIFAGVWIILAVVFILLYRRYARKPLRSITITVEVLTAAIAVGAFCAITSLAVDILPPCTLIDAEVPELIVVLKICPVSKGETAMLGFAVVLFILTLILLLVQECCASRREKRQAQSMQHGKPMYYQVSQIPSVAQEKQVNTSIEQEGLIPAIAVSAPHKTAYTHHEAV